jgi:hypothetical protein
MPLAKQMLSMADLLFVMVTLLILRKSFFQLAYIAFIVASQPLKQLCGIEIASLVLLLYTAYTARCDIACLVSRREGFRCHQRLGR